MRRSNNASGGFTIVEVLLGLFIVTAVIGIAYQLLTISYQTSARAEQHLAASSVVFAKIQEYENMAFEDIPIGDSGSNFVVEDFSAEVETLSDGIVKNSTAIVEVEEISGSLKLLRASIDFPFSGQDNTRLIEYATYIQLGGVGR